VIDDVAFIASTPHDAQISIGNAFSGIAHLGEDVGSIARHSLNDFGAMHQLRGCGPEDGESRAGHGFHEPTYGTLLGCASLTITHDIAVALKSLEHTAVIVLERRRIREEFFKRWTTQIRMILFAERGNKIANPRPDGGEAGVASAFIIDTKSQPFIGHEGSITTNDVIRDQVRQATDMILVTMSHD
jgi:hypothetical protein